MQARYPKNIVILVEGLVGPLDDDAALDWMRERAVSLRSRADVPHALLYRKNRSSGTLAKPRFLSVFETPNTDAALYETSLGGSEALKNYMSWPERVSSMHPRITNVHVWSFDFFAAL